MERVVTNQMVFKLVAKSVSLYDMKEIRMSCKVLNTLLMSVSNFLQKSLLVVDVEWVLRSKEKVTASFWHNVHLKLFDSQLVDSMEYSRIEWILELVKSCRYLKISLKQEYLSFGKGLRIPRRFLCGLLSSPARLIALSIDLRLISVYNVLHMRNLAIAELKHLDFSHSSGLACVWGYKDDTSSVLQVLRSAKSLLSLKIAGYFLTTDAMAIFAKIVRQNPELEVLHLETRRLREFQRIPFSEFLPIATDYRLPKLKSIKVDYVDPEDSELLFQFLKNHKGIQKLEIGIEYQTLAYLQNFMNNFAQDLRSISLRSEGLDLHRGQTISFRKCTSLSEIDLDIFSYFPTRPHVCQICDVLQTLPDTISSFQAKCRGQPLGPNFVAEINLQYLNASILYRLSLVSCGSAITETTVAYICKNFFALQYLNLSFSLDSNCTDYGFVGSTESQPRETGIFNICDLKGLASLTIKSFGHITDWTLLKGIKFKHLRHLDIRGNRKVTHDGVIEVIRNNPKLSTLKTSVEEIQLVQNYVEANRSALKIKFE